MTLKLGWRQGCRADSSIYTERLPGNNLMPKAYVHPSLDMCNSLRLYFFILYQDTLEYAVSVQLVDISPDYQKPAGSKAHFSMAP